MTKTIFEEMGGTYRQVGDYLLPNITVQTKETECIGLSLIHIFWRTIWGLEKRCRSSASY